MGKKGYSKMAKVLSPLIHGTFGRVGSLPLQAHLHVLMLPLLLMAGTTLAPMPESSSHTFLLRRHTLLPVDKMFLDSLDQFR